MNAAQSTAPSSGWLVCGALFSFGTVGMLTGLVLIPPAVALFDHLQRNRKPGRWLGVIGLGSGPLLLFWGDVVGHPSERCVSTAHGGYACRAAGAVPGLFIGVSLVGAGLLLGVVSMAKRLRLVREDGHQTRA